MSQLDLNDPRDAFLCGLTAVPLNRPLEDEDYVASLLATRGWGRKTLTEALTALHQETSRLLLDLPADGKHHAARGLVCAHGVARVDERGEVEVQLSALPEAAVQLLSEVTGQQPETVPNGHRWNGVAALDALGSVMGSSPRAPCLPTWANTFKTWCTSVASLNSSAPGNPEIRVQRLRQEAIVPAKERVSDSGYDLTLLYIKKAIGPVTLYGTGLVIEPPQGWYFDVVPRSSIIKRGYLLANNVGIIDRSYRGEIFVPLLKTDKEADDLELPARVAQLIPRPIVHLPVREYDRLTATERGAGGFGSTGK